MSRRDTGLVRGIVSKRNPDESYSVLDEREVRRYREAKLGLRVSDVELRLRQDERVFSVAAPEELMQNAKFLTDEAKAANSFTYC